MGDSPDVAARDIVAWTRGEAQLPPGTAFVARRNGWRLSQTVTTSSGEVVALANRGWLGMKVIAGDEILARIGTTDPKYHVVKDSTGRRVGRVQWKRKGLLDARWILRTADGQDVAHMTFPERPTRFVAADDGRTIATMTFMWKGRPPRWQTWSHDRHVVLVGDPGTVPPLVILAAVLGVPAGPQSSGD